jgi:UDP-2-acetamido-2,6-beta-L-arabino-hexul-4-ose reductase
MDILVTGANGFIGRNLTEHLKQHGYINIMEYDIDTAPELLEAYASRCDFVFHIAGVNRPQDDADFTAGNVDFTKTLLETLEKYGSKAPVLASSSVQAKFDNPYGRSKKAMEELVFSYAVRTGVPVFVYRLQNVFGKWGKPGYNSVIATFCHRIANGIPITVDERETVMNLVYIDDVIMEFINALQGNACHNGEFCTVKPVYTEKLGQIADLIQSFRDSRDTLYVPNISDDFTKKLYSTYLSYLPADGFDYPLNTHSDSRGSFTEFLRTSEGQISVNILSPGSIKGNHWHHTKNEKFLVISGEGVIRFRDPSDTRITEYYIDGNNLRVIDVPPGYTHSIENIGDEDMVTLIWANECFNPENPDTYALEV